MVAAGLGLWLVSRTADERAGSPEPAGEVVAPPPVAPNSAFTLPSSPPAKPDIAPQPSSADSARPAAPEVVGPHPDDPHEPGMLPHPMGDERERIHAENRLIQRLNDAMSFRKVPEMREMLLQYRKLDPTDVDASQAGYKVIADCIEFPGDPSSAAAREFYDTQRHSPLRRWVRRICFENSH